jgi:oxygen-dependent protoporphyrinogen oxidase
MHLNDEEVVEATLAEVGRHLAIDLQPTQISITRWHGAFPQYRPHHHDRVAEVESQLPDRVALAGASYRGIGIPACIADGQRAASRIKRSIASDDDFLP